MNPQRDSVHSQTLLDSLQFTGLLRVAEGSDKDRHALVVQIAEQCRVG